MTPSEMKERTKVFALAVLRLVDTFPRSRTGWVVGDQLLRSGTSVAANYRSACRARSKRDFIAKLGIVEEEADETGFWLELASASGLGDSARVTPLQREANELVAIVVSSIRTARKARIDNPQSAIRNPQCS